MTGASDDKEAMIARFDQAFAKGVPLNAALGLSIVDFGEADAAMKLPYRADLVGNPITGVLHGGAVTSLLDATCGAAVFMRLWHDSGRSKIPRIATLDLRIDYLKPATPHRDVIARAHCYKRTKQIAFVRALAYHDDEADPIAAAAGTFMIFQRTPSNVEKEMTE